MNERSDIYRESFHLKLGSKAEIFPLKSSKNKLWPIFTHAQTAQPMLNACESAENAPSRVATHALGAWPCSGRM